MSRIHKVDPERADHPTQKPLEIVERMVKASCPPGGIILDPFMGTGTTAVAAQRCGRQFVGFELNPVYCEIIARRLGAPEGQLTGQNNQPSEPVRSKIADIVKGKKNRKSKKNPEEIQSDSDQQVLTFL